MKKFNLAAALAEPLPPAEAPPLQVTRGAPLISPEVFAPDADVPRAPPPPPTIQGPPPEPVKAPEGYDEIFAAAMTARHTIIKGGHADFMAAMAQAEALRGIQSALESLVEFLGVYDNEDEPREPPLRLEDLLKALGSKGKRA